MYLGDFTTSNTVYVYFNTFDSNDPSASVTLTGLAVGDILIYKNGSVTQRSSTSGFTLLDTDGIDFDGNTGIHGFSIDLSDNTDASFYAAGNEYTIVVASVTVDAATVNFVAGSFSIERSGGALALLKGTNSLSAIKADTAAILTDTAEIGTAGAGLTNINLPDQTMNITGNITGNLSGSVGSISGVTFPTNFGDLAITATTGLMSVGTNNDKTGYSISGSITTLDGLNDLDAAGVATAVWNAATATYGSAGSYGLLVETNLDAAVSGATAPTAAAVADAVWDEVISGHLTAGSTGEALNAAGAAGDPWTTSLPGAYSAGQAGYIVGTNIDAPLSTIDTNVDAILADTADMQPKLGTPAGASVSADIAAVKADTAATLVDTAEIGTAGAGLTALASAANLATVDANVDAILVDTGTTIPAAIPTATENADALLNRDMSAVSDTNARSPLNALRLLRNKYSISGTTLTVTKEDDTTSAWTSTLTTNASAEPVTGSDPA